MSTQSKEQGQVIVILAMGMVVLLLFAALAIDGGNIYSNRRIAQNAADSAAVAGTQKLQELCAQGSLRWDLIVKTVDQYVKSNAGEAIKTLPNGSTTPGSRYRIYYVDGQGNRLNGDLTIDAVGTIPCGCVNGQSVGFKATGIEVDVDKTFNTFLAGLVGRSQSAVSVKAKGNYLMREPRRANEFNSVDVYPIAVVSDTYHVGDDITFFNEDGNEYPGNFGWLSWRNVNDAPSLNRSLEVPPAAPDTVSNYVNPDMGQHGTPDAPLAVGKRVSGGPGLKNGDIEQLYGKTIVVPLYDPNPQLTNGQGSHFNYYVVGWLAIKPYYYHKQGNKSEMKAIVQQWVAPGSSSDEVNECETPLMYSVNLTN